MYRTGGETGDARHHTHPDCRVLGEQCRARSKKAILATVENGFAHFKDVVNREARRWLERAAHGWRHVTALGLPEVKLHPPRTILQSLPSPNPPIQSTRPTTFLLLVGGPRDGAGFASHKTTVDTYGEAPSLAKPFQRSTGPPHTPLILSLADKEWRDCGSGYPPKS